MARSSKMPRAKVRLTFRKYKMRCFNVKQSHLGRGGRTEVFFFHLFCFVERSLEILGNLISNFHVIGDGWPSNVRAISRKSFSEIRWFSANSNLNIIKMFSANILSSVVFILS